MKRRSEIFSIAKKMEWEDLGGGISRKIMGWDNQIMMVIVRFEKAAVGNPHQHFQTQTTYVAGGKFEFTVDGEKQIVEAGDGIYIAPNLMHGAVCLEAGILIDVFSPVREDFLEGGGVSYFGKK